MLCIAVVGTLIGLGATWRDWERGAQLRKPEVFVPRIMTVKQVEQELSTGGVVVLDARTRVEFEAGHVPGALALFSAPGQSLLGEARRCVSQDAEVVLVGVRERDLNALRLAQRVREWGVPRVRIMKGGMVSWKAAGFEIDKGWDMGPILRLLEMDS